MEKNQTNEEIKVRKIWLPRTVRGVCFIIAIALIAHGANSLVNRYQAVSGTAPEVETGTIVTSDTDQPGEIPPTEEYVVAPDMPRRIILPTLNAEGFIQQVGTTEDNAVAVPTNIHVAGWYVESVKPGEVGLSIIDGHVTGKYNDGVFKHLDTLRPGDQFSIEYGDLTTRNFEVVDTRTLPEEESAAFLFTKDENIESQLNLITCGGNFDNNSQTYADRVIVVAKAL